MFANRIINKNSCYYDSTNIHFKLKETGSVGRISRER